MEIAYQLMMALGLASCTGCRTYLPLLVVGVMARSGHIQLNPSFACLQSNTLLIIFLVAAILELVGDKIIAVDHVLDAVGTLARPLAGTLLAGSLLKSADPATAMILGLIAGGVPATVIHSAKTLTRAKASLFAPLHMGIANLVMSAIEDVLTTIGIAVSLLWPILAFVFALAALAAASVLVYFSFKAGLKLYSLLTGNPVLSAVPSQTPSSPPPPITTSATQIYPS